MQHIPNPDLSDAQRWAEDAAADEDAELTYQRMCEDANRYAEMAAAEAEAEAASHALDEADARETDLF
jgi:hypothetical protein